MVSSRRHSTAACTHPTTDRLQFFFLFWMSKRVVFSALMVRLSQSIPKYPRVSQSIPEYPRVSQSIPDYPRLSQSRVCQAVRDYSDNLRLSETIQDYPRRSQWILEYPRVFPTIPNYSIIPGLLKEEKLGRVEKNILFSDFRRFSGGVNIEKITLCRYAGDVYNLFLASAVNKVLLELEDASSLETNRSVKRA